METFEFLVTSTVQATLYEHIKIQALNYEDAVTRIEDRGIIDGDGSIQSNGSPNAFCITITAHESWTQFYQEFMETLDIPEHISNREGSTTIRICRREILQLLQDVITNNNLFHLKRKWNKLMIKEPSASES